MAKKTAKELKEEGAELSTLIAQVRKRPHNFALMIAKEGLVLEVHPKRGPDILKRQAKSNGAGSKGAAGIMKVKGKVIHLEVPTEDYPATLPKLAKKHFSDRGLPMKVVISLPEVEEEEEKEAPKEEKQVRKPSEPEQTATPAKPKKPVLAETAPEASKPTEDAKTPEPPKEAASEVSAENTDALRKNLISEFKDMEPRLQMAFDATHPGAVKKVKTLASNFATTVQGDDLSRAGASLTLLNKTVDDVIKKFGNGEAKASAPPLDDLFGDLFKALGPSQDAELGPVLGPEEPPVGPQVAPPNIPPKLMTKLEALKDSDPKTYATAMAAVQKLDPTGTIDVSPKGYTDSLKKLQAAQQKVADALKAYQVERDKSDTLELAEKKAKDAHDAALVVQKAAQKAVADFMAATPQPMTAQQAAQLTPLTAALTAADADVVTKQTALTAATTAFNAQVPILNATVNAYHAETPKLDAARKDQKAYDDKKALMDALSFGPLSPTAEKPLNDAQRAIMIEAYGNSPDLGQAALEAIAKAQDPAKMVENVGYVSGKLTDGFADKDGKRISATQEQQEKMAANAIKLGAHEGPEYFEGLKSYLESGEQHKKDDSGALDPADPDPKKEAVRQKKVNVKRAAMVAGKVLKSDGTVDFDSADAKGAMNDMKFHPGSLLQPAPAVIDQMQSLEADFKNPKFAAKMTATMAATKLPAGDNFITGVSKTRSSELVSRTLAGDAKTPPDDMDAKKAVLAGMMSPIYQGEVGSCFTTGPVRKMRQEEPDRAMENMSNMLQTGQFKGSSGKVVPVNMDVLPGENPMVRSLEYSLASVAASAANNFDRRNMNNGLWDNSAVRNDADGNPIASGGLNDLAAIVGPDKWNNSQPDPAKGIVLGMRAKLENAIRNQLNFTYDSTTPSSGGGGDGSSSLGYLKLTYNNVKIENEAQFITALRAIAFFASGELPLTQTAKDVDDLVTSPEFIKWVKAGFPGGDYPWAIGGGGFSTETTRSLNGGNVSAGKFMNPVGANVSEGDRTRALLDGLLANYGGPGDEPNEGVWTSGNQADHAFNIRTQDPGFQALRDPDSAAKIEAKLMAPGREIMNKDLGLEKTVDMFEEQVRAAGSGWASSQSALILVAMDKKPTTDMSPKKLRKHVETVLEPACKAEIKARFDRWKKNLTDRGNPPSGADETKKKDEIEKALRKALARGSDFAMINEFDPPQVVVADTNWGSYEDNILFVMAPNPMTGELMMWKKHEISGDMWPAGDNWAGATYRKIND